MSKRNKPMTIEQKREKMLSIFHERQEVFNLRDIEKFSTKAGIVLPTVKDVLMSLISDGLVDADKIGSANFYWSLPSQTLYILKLRLGEAQVKSVESDQKKIDLEKELEQSMEGKEPDDDRTINLNKLKQVMELFKKKEKDLEKYQRNDPERLKLLGTLKIYYFYLILRTQLEKQTTQMKDKVNFWTDNLFSLKSYIQKCSPMSDEEMEKAFQIPSDLDNV